MLRRTFTPTGKLDDDLLAAVFLQVQNRLALPVKSDSCRLPLRFLRPVTGQLALGQLHIHHHLPRRPMPASAAMATTMVIALAG